MTDASPNSPHAPVLLADPPATGGWLTPKLTFVTEAVVSVNDGLVPGVPALAPPAVVPTCEPVLAQGDGSAAAGAVWPMVGTAAVVSTTVYVPGATSAML